MYSDDHNASPFNSLPPLIVAVAGLIVVIELVLQAGAAGLIGGPEAVGWRVTLVQRFGFYDPVFEYMRQTTETPLEGLIPLVSYLFIHAGFTHILFGAVLLLALGNYVSQLFSQIAILVALLVSGALAAVIYGLIIDTRVPLIGIYPAVYGLIGLYTWMLWVAAEELGQNRYAAFRMVALLVAIQIGFGLIAGAYDGLVADIAGFCVGFSIATLLAPGGLRRVRERLQG